MFVLFSIQTNAQNIGINSTGAAPNSSAMLDRVDTDINYKMNTSQVKELEKSRIDLQ